MAAVKYDITIEQGTTFSLILSLKKPNKLPIDLTGYTGKCQIRKVIPSSEETEVVAEPVFALLEPATEGKFSLTLSDDITSSLDFHTAEYDVILQDGTGIKSRLIQGSVKLSPTITVWNGSSGYSGNFDG